MGSNPQFMWQQLLVVMCGHSCGSSGWEPAMVSAELVALSSQASTKSQLTFFRKYRRIESLSHRLASTQVCIGNNFPDMWIDAPKYWLEQGMLACSSYSSWALQLSAERQREGDVRRQASKGVHLTALFADRGMHTSTSNHTAVNQCGGLSMERFKVNKHHSPLAETAGSYVHLGCVPAALLHVHSSLLLLYSNVWGSLLLRLNWHACVSICCPAADIACALLIIYNV